MMTIAIISTLISSIALAGVAISLFLQARQLRSAQLEASRTAQSGLITMALTNSRLVSEALGEPDSNTFAKSVYINWRFKYMELSYSLGAISAAAVRNQAMIMFKAEFPRTWWTTARDAYRVEAATKLEKGFVAIVDEAFTQATQLQVPDRSKTNMSSSQAPDTGPSSR
jgi:hypothetical protein